MLQVSIVSDLHLEFSDIELPGGDILVMAGDIFVASRLQGNKTDADSRKLRKRFERFARVELGKYEKSIHVNGNHENYHGCIEDSSKIIKDFLCEFAPNAVNLDNESVVIDGVAFLGTTLWANCGAGDPMAELRIGGCMNDFHLIRTREIDMVDSCRWGMTSRKFRPADAAKLHQRARRWLGKALAGYRDTGTPCVVVTHHAPSLLAKASDWKHADDDMDDAYYSNLHRLIKANPQIKIWASGHTHSSHRQYVGGTLLVSNQRGYFPSEGLSRDFDPSAADFDFSELSVKHLHSSLDPAIPSQQSGHYPAKH
jgi:hypothetical protein